MALDTFKGYQLNGATVFDIWSIYQLEKEIFPKDAYSLLELGIQFCLPRSLNYKLTTEGSEVVGFVSAMNPWWPGRTAWIITIGVASAHQRQGLGRYLLNWIEPRISSQYLRLTVRASNQAAINLYQSAGYIYLRRHPRYYLDGEDGFIFEKRLDK